MPDRKHLKNIPEFNGTIEELAVKISRLDYCSVKEFIIALTKELKRQAKADLERKPPRTQLSNKLYEMVEKLEETLPFLEKICKICTPHNEKVS